jgi:nitroreductase
MTVCADMRIDSCPVEGFIPAKYDEILGLTEK